MAQGTAEQNVTIGHLASAVGDVSEKTRVNSEMAHKANNLGLSIKQSAEKSSGHMKNMMNAVHEINLASQSFVLADTVARFKLRDADSLGQGKQAPRLPEANRK